MTNDRCPSVKGGNKMKVEYPYLLEQFKIGEGKTRVKYIDLPKQVKTEDILSDIKSIKKPSKTLFLAADDCGCYGFDIGTSLIDLLYKINKQHPNVSIDLNYLNPKMIQDSPNKYIKLFKGSNRRQELIANVGGIKLYDDYAHHPSEIMATLKAFRTWYKLKKILVIFQPHTYSRTKTLFSEFSRAFIDADRLILTDIYASARERHDPSISSEMLAAEANKYKRNAFY